MPQQTAHLHMVQQLTWLIMWADSFSHPFGKKASRWVPKAWRANVYYSERVADVSRLPQQGSWRRLTSHFKTNTLSSGKVWRSASFRNPGLTHIDEEAFLASIRVHFERSLRNELKLIDLHFLLLHVLFIVMTLLQINAWYKRCISFLLYCISESSLFWNTGTDMVIGFWKVPVRAVDLKAWDWDTGLNI